MLSAIDYVFDEDNSKEALIITGCPGSGKTTVITNRALVLTEEKSNFFYLIYPRLLLAYLKLVANGGDVDETKIDNFHNWFYYKFDRTSPTDLDEFRTSVVKSKFESVGKLYDELIIDEGQDLWRELYELLPIISNKLTISCDNAQDVMNNFENADIEKKIHEILEESDFFIQSFPLTTNFRNTPSIYNFAKGMVPDMPTAAINAFFRTEGAMPKVFIDKDDNLMLGRIKNLIKSNPTKNIGILCETVHQVKRIKAYLEKCSVNHIYYHSDMARDIRDKNLKGLETTNVVITTHISCKGLEFEIVIIPFGNAMKNDSCENPIMKAYYVAATRAREDLIVLCASTIPDVIAKMEGANPPLFEKIDKSNLPG